MTELTQPPQNSEQPYGWEDVAQDMQDWHPDLQTHAVRHLKVKGFATPEAKEQTLPWPEFVAESETDPSLHPNAFSQFVSDSLALIGIDDPYDVILSGIDGTELQARKTFGDRKATYALYGNQLRLDALQAEQEGRWALNSSVYYALHFHPSSAPMIVAFDRSKMRNLSDDPEHSGDEWGPREGSLDDAVTAVFRLPPSSEKI